MLDFFRKDTRRTGAAAAALVLALVLALSGWWAYSTHMQDDKPNASAPQQDDVESNRLPKPVVCAPDQIKGSELQRALLHGRNNIPTIDSVVDCLSKKDALDTVAKQLPGIHKSIDETNAGFDRAIAESDGKYDYLLTTGTAREQLAYLLHHSCDLLRNSSSEATTAKYTYEYTYFTDVSEATLLRVIEWFEQPVVFSSGEQPTKPSVTPPFYGSQKEVKVTNIYDFAEQKFDELWDSVFERVLAPEIPKEFSEAVAKRCGVSSSTSTTETHDDGYPGYPN